MDILKMGGRIARLPWVSLRNAIEPPVLVLAYHRVADSKGDTIGMAVSPENFRSQMLHLRETYHVLRFEEDWNGIDRRSVVITFDDGYADNCHNALPILEECDVPACFFVSSQWIGSREESWWDELERIFLGPAALPPDLTLRLEAGSPEVLPTSSAKSRRDSYKRLHRRMKLMSKETRDETLSFLRNWSGAGHNPRPSHRSMDLAELKKLASSPLATIGAHTVTHRMLSGLSRSEQEREIVDSRTALEGWLGKPVDTFSYPFGDKADYDQNSVDVCRSAGFKKAAAAHPGQARKSTDPMRIPRCFVHNWDASGFAKKMRLFFNT